MHRIHNRYLFSLLMAIFMLSSCAPALPAKMASTPTEQPGTQALTTTIVVQSDPATETAVIPPTPSETVPPTATPDLRLDPNDWQSWPIIPTVSASAKELYARGLAMGNNPAHFSKVGDCQNITTYFLAVFDDPEHYDLGADYAHLQETIDHFSGSFLRDSVATSGGMNVASVLSQFWADKGRCESKESPLACELRLHQPSIVLISMEESWGSNNKVENYEKYMRRIIEQVMDAGAVPILATKADNVEGGHQINQAIVRLAHEYDIPLWNFWLAVQPLPQQGVMEDGFHLTGPNFFNEPRNLKQGWPMRNFTALQVIDSVWRQLNEE